MSEFIKNWQSSHGLNADGVIGKQTMLKIQEVYKIPSVNALIQLMANLDNETGGFTVFEENLNYSSQGLLKTFPKYFKTLKDAELAAHKPEIIANKVYGGRMGNVNQGDGYKFRGRGTLQTTGRTNYTLLSKSLGVDLTANPELVKDKYAFDAAIFYVSSNHLWNLASLPITIDSVTRFRKAVNGGSIGLTNVINLINKYKSIMK